MKYKYSNDTIQKKIITYLIIFVALILVLLYAVQVVFLEDIYTSMRLRNIQNEAQDITNYIEGSKKDFISEEELIKYIAGFSQESNNTYYITYLTDMELKPKTDPFSHSKVTIGINKDKDTLNALMHEAMMSKNGTAQVRSTLTYSYLNTQDGQHQIITDNFREMVTYAQIVHTPANDYVVFIRGDLQLLDPMKKTIQSEFMFIAISLGVISLILGGIISRYIGNPIVKVNQSAKELAKGNYDVTFDGRGYIEIQELSATLNYATDELSKVDELRKELIANMSHDLRTPLTMIRGYAEVMRDIPGEANPENLQIIIDETTRLSTLVNDILDMSKIEAGKQELNLTVFSLTNLVEKSITRINGLLKEEPYEIIFQRIDDVYVEADESKIGQVIYNTILNAITHIGKDNQVIVRQILDGDIVRIEIEDHGEGIAKNELPYIWEMYYRTKKNHKRSKSGSGIGLSIVKTILTQHKQEFGVRSKEGKGTTVWFELEVCNSNIKDN